MSHRGNVIACACAALLALASGVGLPPVSVAEAAVSGTKHNLSTGGPGTRKATTETEICIFCHAPHNTSPAAQLWNRRLPTAAYTPYSSSTLKSVPGQPNGASLLCLSCHDGTIALGDVLSRATPITMAGGAMSGNPLIGTNLADDHPISFVYNAALRTARGELADPATLTGAVRLDGGGRLQCTSCHDPHDSTNGKFLVMANTASALCTTCHQKNFWTQTDHRTSTRIWNGAGTNPWPHTSGTTVAANACENCHRPHTAGGAQSLVNYAAEETNCTTCHNGNVAVKNVQAEFAKASAHDVGTFTGIHTPAEATPPATAHVECVDCHNPHAARATTLPTKGGSTVPTLSGALEGVKGVTIANAAVNPASFEYEICFRCHGPSNPVTAQTARVIVTNNTIAEFATTNPSFHPVAGTGRSTTVPSLISPWTTASRMTCTDCHNNNVGPYSTGTGTTPTGTGVNGAHGSTNPLLLERAYQKADGASSSAGTTESATAYALCYKCHDRSTSGKGIIASSVTGSFRYHNLHVVSQRTPCNTCHDPHGVSASNGATTLSNSRLINFRTGVVTAVSGQAIRWERVGTTGGRCYLVCHGASHNPYTY